MIEFKNVSKSFLNGKKIEVIDHISFEVAEKEFFCIVGPSGCGKSTIINLLAGFISPDDGKIVVNNEIVSGPSYKRTVVFQEFALFPWKTVFENIEFGLKCKNIKKEDRKKIIENILNKIHLKQFAHYYPDQLSGGMKQKVALGRALAVEPEIILMDEPFASLDQQTRDILQEELIKFQAYFSQTIIFVTHNIEEALFLGDKILLLSDRPASAKSIINVPFDRPRNPDIRNTTQFIELKHKIWHSLREEIK